MTVVAGRAAPDPNRGVAVVTSDVPIKPPAFATVKSVNYLPNAMVVADARESRRGLRRVDDGARAGGRRGLR